MKPTPMTREEAMALVDALTSRGVVLVYFRHVDHVRNGERYRRIERERIENDAAVDIIVRATLTEGT